MRLFTVYTCEKRLKLKGKRRGNLAEWGVEEGKSAPLHSELCLSSSEALHLLLHPYRPQFPNV